MESSNRVQIKQTSPNESEQFYTFWLTYLWTTTTKYVALLFSLRIWKHSLRFPRRYSIVLCIWDFISINTGVFTCPFSEDSLQLLSDTQLEERFDCISCLGLRRSALVTGLSPQQNVWPKWVKGERVRFSLPFEGAGHRSRAIWQQKPGAAGPLCAVGTRDERWHLAPFLSQSRAPVRRSGPPTFRVALPTSVNLN